MAFPSNPIYKLVNHPISGALSCIRTADERFIPMAATAPTTPKPKEDKIPARILGPAASDP